MIRTLRLVDFRTFADCTWEPDPGCNVVIARNDAGKTSLRAAIEWVLAGRAYALTDERGAGADALIRHGAEAGIVEAILFGADGDEFGVRRRVFAGGRPGTLEVQGISGSVTVQAEAMAKKLGRGPDVASVALNVGRLLDRPASEQQAMILALSGASWSHDQIAAALASDGARRAMDAVGCGDLAGGADALTRLEKRARDGRTEQKRERDRFAAELKSMPAVEPISAAARAAAEQAVRDLRVRRDEAVQARGRAFEANASRQRLERERDKLRVDRAAAEARLAGKQREPLPEPPDVGRDEAEAAAMGATKSHVEASSARAAARADVSTWDAAILALGKAADGKCPFCPAIECGVEVAPAAAAMAAGRQRAVDRLAAAEDHVRKAQEDASRWSAVAKRAGDAETAGRARADVLTNMRRSVQEAGERIAVLDAEIAGLPATVAEEPLRLQADELERQGQREAAVLDAARKAEELSERRADVGRRLEQAEARCADLEALCAEFGPGGLRSRLLDPVLDSFLASADAVMAATAGARVGLAADGGIEVAGDRWAEPVRGAALSRSMRLRLGIALQAAVCRAAGWPLLVVDDADALDHQNRGLATEVLLRAAGDGLQVICLAAQPSADLPRDPGIDGLALWTITDGQIVRLPSSGESGVA